MTPKKYCPLAPGKETSCPSDCQFDSQGYCGWCDECDFFEACQEVHKTQPKILVLILKERYYDEMLAGTKTKERRVANDYYLSRIRGKEFDIWSLSGTLMKSIKDPARDQVKKIYILYTKNGHLKFNTWTEGEIITL